MMDCNHGSRAHQRLVSFIGQKMNCGLRSVLSLRLKYRWHWITSAICNRLLVCVRWASANRKATATDSGSFDCISSIHVLQLFQIRQAIRATISRYGIWAEGISSGRAHSHHFGEGFRQTPPHEQVPRYSPPPEKPGGELAGEADQHLSNKPSACRNSGDGSQE